MLTLVVGDPHIRIGALEDGKVLLDRILSTALERRLSRILLLGDLFHTFAIVRVEVLEAWTKFFKTAADSGLVVMAIAGNHDYAGQNGGGVAFAPFDDQAWLVKDGFVELQGIHYAAFHRDRTLFEERCRDLPAGGFLVCHQSFEGSRFESGTYDPDGADPACVAHLSAVMSGHVHLRQAFANIWHPGTPMQHGFQDSGSEKRVFVAELSPSGYKIVTEVDLGLPRFHTIEAPTPIQALQAIMALGPVDSSDSYRIVTRGGPAELAALWAEPSVLALRSACRRLVDATVPDRGEGTLEVHGNSESERFNSFIAGKKWRTSPDRVATAASALLPR